MKREDANYLQAPFKFIDLFAGIGGFHLALSSLGGECVFASEIDRYACDTYEANHGMRPHGDITQINACDIPDHDVLTAGFPCQPFSQAGAKLGIRDTRGTLFFDVARIMGEKRPRFAILENVKGLISNDHGYTLLTILKTLRERGYKTVIPDYLLSESRIQSLKEAAKVMLMNSRYFGVPQNRIRIYIVAWRDDLNLSYRYPPQEIEEKCLGDILETQEEYVSKFTISDRLWTGLQARKVKNKQAGKGFGYSLFDATSLYANTISARYYKDGKEILIDQGAGRNPRRITPREAARLQGFPESFVPYKSRSQAYKQFGNSVTVSVVNAIVQQLLSITQTPDLKKTALHMFLQPPDLKKTALHMFLGEA